MPPPLQLLNSRGSGLSGERGGGGADRDGEEEEVEEEEGVEEEEPKPKPKPKPREWPTPPMLLAQCSLLWRG